MKEFISSLSKNTKIILINAGIVIIAIFAVIMFLLRKKDDGATKVSEAVSNSVDNLVKKKKDVIKEHDKKIEEIRKEREKKVNEIENATEDEVDKIIRDRNL